MSFCRNRCSLSLAYRITAPIHILIGAVLQRTSLGVVQYVAVSRKLHP
jgi:hypothetical protein